MEDPLIRMVSYLLEPDSEGAHNNDHHAGTSEVHHHTDEVGGELLLDFVPYAHDSFIPLRDRAFSWDVHLENDVDEKLLPLVVFESARVAEGNGVGIAEMKLVIHSNEENESEHETVEMTASSDEEGNDSDDGRHLDELDDDAILIVHDSRHQYHLVKDEGSSFLDEESSRPTITSIGTTFTVGTSTTTSAPTTSTRLKRSIRARSERDCDSRGANSFRTPDVKHERTAHAEPQEYSSTGRPTRRAVLSRSSSADYAYGKGYSGGRYNRSSQSASANFGVNGNGSSHGSKHKSGNGNGNHVSTTPAMTMPVIPVSAETPGLQGHNAQGESSYISPDPSSSHSKYQQAAFRPPGMKNALALLQSASLSAGSGSANGASGGDEAFRINGSSSSAFPSSSSSGALGMLMAVSMNDGERRVGIYTVEERRMKIEKFRERKRQRIWRKQIKYDCRKRLADNRPRVKGRFVSRKNLGSGGSGGGGVGLNGGVIGSGEGNGPGVPTGEGEDGENSDDNESDADSAMVTTGNDVLLSTMRIVPPPMQYSSRPLNYHNIHAYQQQPQQSHHQHHHQQHHHPQLQQLGLPPPAKRLKTI